MQWKTLKARPAKKSLRRYQSVSSAFLLFYCGPGREIASHWSDLETCLAAKIPGQQKLSLPREKQDLLCLPVNVIKLYNVLTDSLIYWCADLLICWYADLLMCWCACWCLLVEGCCPLGSHSTSPGHPSCPRTVYGIQKQLEDYQQK